MESSDHNLDVFDDETVTADYEHYSGPTFGFLDRGEAEALVAVARSASGTPILDIGVGGGRTTPLLRLISSDYTALDYAPRMIDAFRRHFPDLPAHVADARDLSRFDDGAFGLVVFSNNGMDTVDHADRLRVMAEMKRILKPDGVMIFSTLNRNGPSFGESPFQVRRPTQPWTFSPQKAVMSLGRKALRPAGVARGIANWRRGRSRAHDHGAWAVGPLAAHDFAPFMHFTTLPDLRELLTSAGLEGRSIFSGDGAVIDSDVNDSAADNFTVIASAI